jgi:Flp pilus assembly protein TadG
MGSRSRAQALVWFTLALPLFMAIAGLAIDGGVLLTSRRELQSVADGAARAGATRLDLDRLRASGGAEVQLDAAGARETTWIYIQERLPTALNWQAPPDARVDVATRRVHVDSVPVEAAAFADVQYGIHAGDGG